MSKSLFVVIAVGIAIGLALPSDSEAPAAAVASAGPETGPAAASPASGPPRETTLERESNGHFFTHATVNGHLVRFLVDTGASVVALTVEDAQRLGIVVDPSTFTVVGEGASGPVRGQLVTLDSVDVDGKRVTDVRGMVLEGSKLSLLGQSYLSRMGEVQMRGDYMVLR